MDVALLCAYSVNGGQKVFRKRSFWEHFLEVNTLSLNN